MGLSDRAGSSSGKNAIKQSVQLLVVDEFAAMVAVGEDDEAGAVFGRGHMARERKPDWPPEWTR